LSQRRTGVRSLYDLSQDGERRGRHLHVALVVVELREQLRNQTLTIQPLRVRAGTVVCVVRRNW
jgi:hypothetical protein